VVRITHAFLPHANVVTFQEKGTAYQSLSLSLHFDLAEKWNFFQTFKKFQKPNAEAKKQKAAS